jgi:hypothetical protein
VNKTTLSKPYVIDLSGETAKHSALGAPGRVPAFSGLSKSRVLLSCATAGEGTRF